jgi:hypothetical protein
MKTPPDREPSDGGWGILVTTPCRAALWMDKTIDSRLKQIKISKALHESARGPTMSALPQNGNKFRASAAFRVDEIKL